MESRLHCIKTISTVFGNYTLAKQDFLAVHGFHWVN